MHTLVFDLETKKTFDEVGGYEHVADLGISLAGVYNYTDNIYHAFRESELDQFAALLQETELLIGFNSIHFDIPVLQPYLPAMDLSLIPHVDMLRVVEAQLGFRVRLENIASTTLGEGKSGSGLDAIRYYRLGQWEALKKYCLDDVRVTKDVYEYGKTHGYVWYTESGTPTKVAVDWHTQPVVDDVLQHGLTEHQQIDVTYIQVSGTGSKTETNRYATTLDIRSIDNGKVTAFSHADQKEKVFDQSKIFSATPNGNSAAHQQSLL